MLGCVPSFAWPTWHARLVVYVAEECCIGSSCHTVHVDCGTHRAVTAEVHLIVSHVAEDTVFLAACHPCGCIEQVTWLRQCELLGCCRLICIGLILLVSSGILSASVWWGLWWGGGMMCVTSRIFVWMLNKLHAWYRLTQCDIA